MNGNPVVGTIVALVGIVIFYLLYCSMRYDLHGDKYSSYLETVISPVTKFRKDRTPPCYKCKYCKDLIFCSRKSAVSDKESKLNTYLPCGVKCDENRGTRFCKFKECSKDELESRKSAFLEAKHRNFLVDAIGMNEYRKYIGSTTLHEDIPHIPFCKD